MTSDSGGESGVVNSSQDLLRTGPTSMPALDRASSAKGFTRPLGALPALCACTSTPRRGAQWLSMPSDSTLRAELWVQRMRTWKVMGSAAGGLGGPRVDGDAQGLAAGDGGGGRRRGG